MSPHKPQPAPFAPCDPAAGPNAEPVHVLKFGSSVLRGLDDLPKVAGEIYRQCRLGRRIVAVVSALGDETDRLFEEAAIASGRTACAGVADLVSIGEERTAALLRIACDRIGLVAAICRAEALGLVAAGAEHDADPVTLESANLCTALRDFEIVIVPGFVGVDRHGSRVLLGRGGSDLTAAILGAGLGAERVCLYKDVDGVFERDPAEDPGALKFARLDYEGARQRASQLIHGKAVDYAERHDLAIEVDAIGGDDPTVVGRHAPRLAEARPRVALRIALAGYGVVDRRVRRTLGSGLDDRPAGQRDCRQRRAASAIARGAPGGG